MKEEKELWLELRFRFDRIMFRVLGKPWLETPLTRPVQHKYTNIMCTDFSAPAAMLAVSELRVIKYKKADSEMTENSKRTIVSKTQP